MKFELGIRDARAVVANFRAADEALQLEVRDAVRRMADRTRRIARRIVPVDTGYMREHIKTILSPSGLAFEVGWDASDFAGAGKPFYPFFVEYGTRFMAARPTLGPAYAEAAPQFEREIAQAIRRAVNRDRRGNR